MPSEAPAAAAPEVWTPEKKEEVGPPRLQPGLRTGREQGPQRAQGRVPGKARCPNGQGTPSASSGSMEWLGLSRLPSLSLGAPSPLTTRTGLALATQGGPGPRPGSGQPCPADDGTMVTGEPRACCPGGAPLQTPTAALRENGPLSLRDCESARLS